MSKILISLAQPIIGKSVKNLVCYYESLISEFKKFGNDVLIYNDTLYKGLKHKKKYLAPICEKIKNFNPDLIITFNNQIREDFLTVTNCPIALFDADCVNLFVNNNLVKKYSDRYFMVTIYFGWEDSYLHLGFSKNKICSIHPATAIVSENILKDKNISFIGSKFDTEKFIIEQYIKNDKNNGIYKSLMDFWNSSDNYNYKMLTDKHCPNNQFDILNFYALYDSRDFILTSILDLGLSLYGLGWEKLARTNYALSSAFNKTPTFSLKQNQDIYNSSKINLSISHPQCEGYSYPWRAYDIMASNGLLISSFSKLLKEQTKDFVNLPMYNSPYEARDLCKKYLNEPNLCKDIIAASNEFINKNGRWKDNFEKLEQFLNVKLVNENIKPGNFEIVDFGDNVNGRKEPNYCVKNIFYGILLVLYNLPIMEKIVSSHSKDKIYKSLEKYKHI